MKPAEAVADYLRDAAFTTAEPLRRAQDARGPRPGAGVREQGPGSPAATREFTGVAPGLPLLPDGRGYRLYLESLFDELSTEIKVLFDRRDPAAVLWPRRAAFERLLATLNGPELAGIWGEDETIGWVYQFFNGADERKKMRDESQAPRNSRELAVRNQFFTPRYVVQFLVDNTLGRTWMRDARRGHELASRCEYFVRPDRRAARHPRPQGPAGPARSWIPPAAPGTSCSTPSTCCSRSTRKRGRCRGRRRRASSPGGRSASDYPTLDQLRARRAVAHRRAQPLRRGHRRPVCADRRPGPLAAGAAGVQGPRDPGR